MERALTQRQNKGLRLSDTGVGRVFEEKEKKNAEGCAQHETFQCKLLGMDLLSVIIPLPFIDGSQRPTENVLGNI